MTLTLDPVLNISTAAASRDQIDACRFGLINRLADDLAHEIKNPLHAMVINLEVLKRRVEKGDREAALERADVLEHEVQRLHVLLEALLRLLRPSREADGPVSVSQILDEVRPLLELRARIARLEFSHTPAPSDAYTSVKPDALRFALLQVGDVVYEAARTGAGSLRLTADAVDEEIHFRIGCTNPVDSALRELTLNSPGPGSLCGLPAAAALLEAPGGSVELEKGAEPGLTVLIRIPRSSFI